MLNWASKERFILEIRIYYGDQESPRISKMMNKGVKWSIFKEKRDGKCYLPKIFINKLISYKAPYNSHLSI